MTFDEEGEREISREDREDDRAKVVSTTNFLDKVFFIIAEGGRIVGGADVRGTVICIVVEKSDPAEVVFTIVRSMLAWIGGNLIIEIIS